MNKKRIFLVGSIFLILVVTFMLVFNINDDKRVILYSWNMDDVIGDNKDNLEYVIKKLEINTLYQTFSTSYLKGNDDSIIKYFHDKDMLVYHLTGEREWGLGEDMTHIYGQIDLVYNFNRKNKNKIDGIAFDIEPYILDEWDDKSLEVYVSKMKKAYEYARKKGVYVILIIPYWYDTIDISLLEELFKGAGDEFSVMNYRIKSTVRNIENEVKFAKLYNKKISTIAEVGFEDDNKFDSFDKIEQDFRKIIDAYDEYDISIAYHDYSTIMKEEFK